MTEDSNSLDKNNLIAQLDRHLDWIKSCDTKSSIVIAGIGIFLTIFTSEHSINMLKLILSQTIQHISFSNFLYLLFFAVSWVVFIYGAYCLVRVLIPRLSKEVLAYEGICNDSLYFFETIAKNNFPEFKEKVINRNQEEEIADILSQIYVNAKICTIKYSYYSMGIKYSFLGVAGVIILYLIGVILIKLGGFS
ncbi:hypothetical protein AM501_09515 [Aneurinibacillus migulanus]|uniref:Pycsar system effector family protein n=1 Tax=Aneurinibacillus migulanus TaxID=47500 RepID=UPI0005BE8463|nr:Pycsar system effector family protein [Aneurinibacillus migulanus]KIV58960.1 hypothetical protein TS64_04145 [Aneurinibacillus migulanus]KPD08518.1 hypothetical protein AM501_09515 [Aneurinibacillus migulanus]